MFPIVWPVFFYTTIKRASFEMTDHAVNENEFHNVLWFHFGFLSHHPFPVPPFVGYIQEWPFLEEWVLHESPHRHTFISALGIAESLKVHKLELDSLFQEKRCEPSLIIKAEKVGFKQALLVFSDCHFCFGVRFKGKFIHKVNKRDITATCDTVSKEETKPASHMLRLYSAVTSLFGCTVITNAQTKSQIFPHHKLLSMTDIPSFLCV